MEDKKLSWDDLFPGQQEPYLQRAEYLIERGYIEEKSVYKLAEILYNKDNDIDKRTDTISPGRDRLGT